MNLNNVKKFIVNLDRRSDRMKSIELEMDYIGWEFERFSAVDTNSHVGCSRSHIDILKIAKKLNLECVLIIEDDCTIMPYAKSLIEQINPLIVDLQFGIMNLSPTLNRPVNRSEKYPLLLDITNLPPKEDHHRGIFATNMILYDQSVYDLVIELENAENLGYYAIDDYIYRFVLPKIQSYAPIMPIGPQLSDWSDVSHGTYNNFYTQTYNWNLYSPVKIPNELLNLTSNKEIKNNKIHLDFLYEN